MANPKRRTSRSKKRMRRSHHALKEPQISYCSHCGEPVLPHRVCQACGYYNGRPIFQVKEKA